MYRITCDGAALYDVRDPELSLISPKLMLEANTTGGGSFTILPNHPNYELVTPLKPVVEVQQDGETIFRGRVTDMNRDIENRMEVELEGVLGYANDTLIPPFVFPDDFTIPSGENVVKTLLTWAITKHNEQAQPFQRFKIGTVTVTDPNNVIVRSSTKYMSFWKFLKEKLFDSSLGGFINVRYEADGNYIDYVSEFDDTNTQVIRLGENIVDALREESGRETYSAILPLGAEITPEEGDAYTLDISTLPDGDIDSDLVKKGKFIYSKSAVDAFGWICANIDDSTWDDVTEAVNLKNKAADRLRNEGVSLSDSVTVTAIDLHYSDSEIEAFRVCKNALIDTGSGFDEYPLTKLEIDIDAPQNTKISIGKQKKTLSYIAEISNILAEATAERLGGAVNGLNSAVKAADKSIAQVGSDLAGVSSSVNALSGTVAGYKDTVSSVGTSGIWHYRKWSSGTVEAWGYGQYEFACTTAYGSLYYAPKRTESLPEGLFSGLTVAEISLDGGGAMFAVQKDSTRAELGYYVYSGINETRSMYVYYHVIGRG